MGGAGKEGWGRAGEREMGHELQQRGALTGERVLRCIGYNWTIDRLSNLNH